jgi:hypothetical protein
MSKTRLLGVQKLLKILYDEDGVASCPHCGSVLNVDDERSWKQHKLFHAFIRYLAENWPESHDFRVEGASQTAREAHLRAWLTVKAGHVVPSVTHDWETDKQYEMVLRLLEREIAWDLAHGRYGWLTPQDGGLTIQRPASTAIFGQKAIGQRAFNDVTRKIFDIAYAETGIDVAEFTGEFENMWAAHR